MGTISRKVRMSETVPTDLMAFRGVRGSRITLRMAVKVEEEGLKPLRALVMWQLAGNAAKIYLY